MGLVVVVVLEVRVVAVIRGFLKLLQKRKKTKITMMVLHSDIPLIKRERINNNEIHLLTLSLMHQPEPLSF